MQTLQFTVQDEFGDAYYVECDVYVTYFKAQPNNDASDWDCQGGHEINDVTFTMIESYDKDDNEVPHKWDDLSPSLQEKINAEIESLV